jgi:hypothetical protein
VEPNLGDFQTILVIFSKKLCGHTGALLFNGGGSKRNQGDLIQEDQH